MVMGNKLGKTVLLSSVFITLLLAVLALTSCTTPLEPTVAPTESAYWYYVDHQRDVKANTVVAALSYSSSLVSKSGVMTWNELVALIEIYTHQVQTGIISSNYPVRLSKADYELFATFTLNWCKYKGKGGIKVAIPRYTSDVNNLIFRIINNEYHR